MKENLQKQAVKIMQKPFSSSEVKFLRDYAKELELPNKLRDDLLNNIDTVYNCMCAMVTAKVRELLLESGISPSSMYGVLQSVQLEIAFMARRQADVDHAQNHLGAMMEILRSNSEGQK